MIRTIALASCALFMTTFGVFAVEVEEGKSSVNQTLDYKIKTIDGEEVALSRYDGKVILVVNVASKCGFTSQYKGLQALQEKYGDKGLVILGFPCNQFGGQESGSLKEIKEFCSTKYSVSFDMFEKVDVNGDNAHPFYKNLTKWDAQPKGAGAVSWNFEKFLIARDGVVMNRFASKVGPNDEALVKAIEAALAAN